MNSSSAAIFKQQRNGAAATTFQDVKGGTLPNWALLLVRPAMCVCDGAELVSCRNQNTRPGYLDECSCGFPPLLSTSSQSYGAWVGAPQTTRTTTTTSKPSRRWENLFSHRPTPVCIRLHRIEAVVICPCVGVQQCLQFIVFFSQGGTVLVLLLLYNGRIASFRFCTAIFPALYYGTVPYFSVRWCI